MTSTPVQFGLVAFSSLLAMLDPIASAPIFINLTKKFSEKRAQIAARASLAAGITLLVFAFAGGKIFSFFGITVPAFQIVGGLLLTLSSMQHLHNTAKATEHDPTDDPSIVPIGIPIIAGGGSISTTMVLAGQARGKLHLTALLVAIGLAIFATFLVLRAAPWLVQKLGKSGQEVLSKVMALLTAVIGVQFIINGTSTVIGQILK